MRAILVILLISFSGCSTYNLTQGGGYDYKGIDFRKYTEKGFQFTPENPEGEYESVGIIEVDFYPEIRQSTSSSYTTANRNNGVWEFDNKEYTVQKANINGTVEYFAIEKLNTDTLIKEIYELANSWGANAVTNLRFESEVFNTGITWSKTTVRGFAIIN